MPEFITRTWHMNKFQKSIIRMLMQKNAWFLPFPWAHTPFPPIIVREYTRWRVYTKSKAIGKLCIWLKKHRAEALKKRKREEDHADEPRDQVSPSLKAQPE